MQLPDRDIQAILKKFGPQIIKYLESVGYFDMEGPYEPTDVLDVRAMQTYLTASKAKNSEVWGALEKYLLPEMVGKGEAFIEIYGLKKVVNVNDIATDYIKERGGDTIKLMTKTDKRKLTNYIWMNSEKNERPLARQILKEPNLSSIVDNSGARTRTIIRTERGRAIRGAAYETAKEAGATTKTWWTVGDARVRPSHRALHGKTIEIQGEYANIISKSKTVMEEFPAEKDANCRCWLEFGFEPYLVDRRNPDVNKLKDLYA